MSVTNSPLEGRTAGTRADAGSRRHALRASATGLVRAARPQQWVKNVLVLAAPFAAGRSFERAVLVDTTLSFVAFCLVASSIYLINDVIDAADDRAHPVKRYRPIAAGVVAVPVAYTASAMLFAAAIAVAVGTSWALVAVIVVYAVAQVGYCLGLKHQPVIDLCIVASGFLLRAIAGGAAAAIPLSPWFLLVTAFGSLFMVSGKRYAEIILFERTGAKIRSSLAKYSASYLRFVWATSAAILITTYALWAFEIREVAGTHSIWTTASIVPFVIAILRYAVDIDGGNAGEPEDIALHDRVLQLLGVCWVLCIALSVYL